METKQLRKIILDSLYHAHEHHRDDIKSFERCLVQVKVQKRRRREIGKAAHIS